MKQDFALFNHYSRQRGKSLSEREQQKRIESFIKDAWAVLEREKSLGEEDKENNKNRVNFAVKAEAPIQNSFKNKISKGLGKSKDLKSLYEIHRAARLPAPSQMPKEMIVAQVTPTPNPTLSPNPSCSLASDSHPGYPNNFHEPLRPFTRPFFLF
jgi:hypothetical protein